MQCDTLKRLEDHAMNKKLNDKNASLVLLVVCFIAYTLVAFTRNAYTAAIAGIVKDGVFSKTDAGIISSSFNITYSVAQIIGSYYVDRISPFKIFTIGLVGTVISNIVMSMSSSFAVIFIARAFSGIAQFGVWPALLKIVSEYVSSDYRRKAMYIMPLGVTSGTILSYLLASAVLDYGNWQDLFVISYIILGLATVAFFITVFVTGKKAETVDVPTQTKPSVSVSENTAPEISVAKLMISSGAIFFCIVAFIKSMIANGISSWMPTMIMESYNVSPGFSSMLTSISTCSNFVSVFWVMLLYPKVFKNQPVAVGMFLLFSLPLTIVLLFIGKIPLILVVVLITFINMFKNAIHQFFTVEIPSAYTKFNKSGMMAGIFNAAACVGGMVAGTIYGYIADSFGWSTTVAVWAVLILLGTVSSFVIIPAWKKFTAK